MVDKKKQEEKAESFIPTYLKKMDGFKKIITASDLDDDVKKKINASIATPNNEFFAILYNRDKLCNRANGYYVCLTDNDKRVEKRHHYFTEEKLKDSSNHQLQEQFALFTNAMLFPEGQISDLEDASAPSLRVTNSGLYVHTIEYDVPNLTDREWKEIRAIGIEDGIISPSISKQDEDNLRKEYNNSLANSDPKEFLQKQIRWTIAIDGQDSMMEQLYNKLCAYEDFRGICAVWSGRTSIHLHFIFDTTYLNKKAFKRQNVPLEYPAIETSEQLREGFKAAWTQLDIIVSGFLAVGSKSDKSLKYPETFRRLPWGIREMDKPSPISGIKLNDQVPQAVFFSHFRAASRKTDGTPFKLFHDPFEFLEATKESFGRSKNGLQKLPNNISNIDHHDAFIDEVNTIFRKTHDCAYPMAKRAEIIDGAVKIYFANHADDPNPASVMIGEYSTILLQGQIPYEQNYFKFPISANQLLIEFVNGNLANIEPPFILTEKEKKYEKEIIDKLHQLSSLGDIRREAQTIIRKLPYEEGITILLTPEGLGKTSTLIDELVMTHAPTKGLSNRRLFYCLASASYAQSKAKCAEFNNRYAKHGWKGVVLYSFNDQLKAASEKLGVSCPTANSFNGTYANMMQAVYAERPDIVEQLEAYKKEFNQAIKRAEKVFIFCVHDVVKTWQAAWGTHSWISPNFQKECTDYLKLKMTNTTWMAKKKSLQDWLLFSTVIYDEINQRDLVSEEEKIIVDCIVNNCKRIELATNKKFTEESLGSQSNLFNFFDFSVLPEKYLQPKFDDCKKILSEGYSTKHLVTIDPKEDLIAPFNSKCIYGKQLGDQYYVKENDWFYEVPFTLIMLTTEEYLYEILQKIAMLYPAKRERLTFLNMSDYITLPADSSRALVQVHEGATKNGDMKYIAKIIKAAPDAVLISNMLEDVQNHMGARGRNEYEDKNVFSIYNMPNAGEYGKCLAVGKYFGIKTPYRKKLLATWNQTLGRNLGFRKSKIKSTEHVVLVSPKFWREFWRYLVLHSHYCFKRA